MREPAEFTALVWITLANLTAVLGAIVIIADWAPWGYVLVVSLLLPFLAVTGFFVADRVHLALVRRWVRHATRRENGGLRTAIRLTED